MALRIFFCTLFLLTAAMAQGQVGTSITEARPEGGIEKLAGIYHRIRFSSVQQKNLSHGGLGLLFKVSSKGEATLFRVWYGHGARQDVLDSLYSRNDSLPPFVPKLVDGVAHPSFFSINLKSAESFEHVPEQELRLSRYKLVPKSDDIAFYEVASRDLWAKVELAANAFTGNVHQYLHPGIGVHVEVGIPRARVDHDWIIGLDNFFNRRAAELPLDTDRAQRNTVHSMVYNVGYAFLKGKSRWTPGLSAMVSHLARRSEGERDVFDSRYGFGLTYTRLFPFSKEYFSFDEGPSVSRYHLSLSFRSSYFFPGSEVFGSGLMFSLNFGIARSGHTIKNYRFKDSFYE